MRQFLQRSFRNSLFVLIICLLIGAYIKHNRNYEYLEKLDYLSIQRVSFIPSAVALNVPEPIYWTPETSYDYILIGETIYVVVSGILQPYDWSETVYYLPSGETVYISTIIDFPYDWTETTYNPPYAETIYY